LDCGSARQVARAVSSSLGRGRRPVLDAGEERAQQPGDLVGPVDWERMPGAGERSAALDYAVDRIFRPASQHAPDQ
jgi:hypothetical protein